MIGESIGPYQVLAELGRGGMGEVYRARDTKLGREVAIKVLPASLSQDAVARERLRREAVAAAGLDHPFVCKVFEIGDAGGHLFIVMELVVGDTLHARLSEKTTTYLLSAADEARAASAPEDALKFIDQALSLWEDDRSARVAELHDRRGRVLRSLGKPDEAIRMCRTRSAHG